MHGTAPNATQVEVHERSGVVVVRPAGPRLDAEVAGDLRATLLKLVHQGHRKVIVDLPAVEFIDSSGLGAIVSGLKQMKLVDRGGDIRLAHVQPGVLAVLEIIRLDRVFSQFPTVDAAVNSFAAGV
jgi:anti-sigma B factor antagonist